ncbi:MAG: hypothetical protein IPJ77_14435 [Planctomycetes bacterium]|nr:hypothetical protein [Planctomycetota bacterium]
MKNLILGLALVACVAACKSSSNASVTDPSGANMPKAECKSSCEGMKECSGAQKAECSGAKAECCKEKPQG